MAVVIGRKCPRCRSRNHVKASSRLWPATVPGMGYYTCRDCGRDFFHALTYSKTVDKRRISRVIPPRTLLACINEDKKQFARIEDISSEGIGLSYNLESTRFTGEMGTVALYNCTNGSLFPGLPVEVMNSRIVTRQLPAKRLTIIRQGVRFRQLNNTQKKLLANLLAQCGSS